MIETKMRVINRNLEHIYNLGIKVCLPLTIHLGGLQALERLLQEFYTITQTFQAYPFDPFF
jgi:hypothetical protein